MSLYRLLPQAGLLAVVLWGCAAVGAAEIERGLLPDASAVLTVNLKQLLHAPVIKEHGLSSLRKVLKNTEMIHASLTAFGLDPLRDLDRLTMAMVPQGEKSDTVAILRGRFDTARFHLAAKQLVKEHGDRLSIHTNDGLKYYRLDSSGEHGSIVFGAGTSSKKGTVLSVRTKGSLLDAFGGACVTLTDKNTLIVASSEKLLKAACDRIAGKGVSLNKPMRRLLEELDGKQTILFALRPANRAGHIRGRGARRGRIATSPVAASTRTLSGASTSLSRIAERIRFFAAPPASAVAPRTTFQRGAESNQPIVAVRIVWRDRAGRRFQTSLHGTHIEYR